MYNIYEQIIESALVYYVMILILIITGTFEINNMRIISIGELRSALTLLKFQG